MLGNVRCPGCGHESDGQATHQMQDFQACPRCGLTAAEASSKMQEELSGMFSRNLNVSGPEGEQPRDQYEHTQQLSTPSQHYYHLPAHLASKKIAETSDEDDAVKLILLQHKVDWSYLLTSQINLFKQAPPDQRTRLIELWRISPPGQARSDGLGGWKETSIEQEEELARVRCEGGISENANPTSARELVRMSHDADMESTLDNQEHPYGAEPYMKSGYELLAERDYNSVPTPSEKTYQHSLDPAYLGREWWRNFVTKQPMEYQYGMFDHMAQFHPSEVRVEREDEEML